MNLCGLYFVLRFWMHNTFNIHKSIAYPFEDLGNIVCTSMDHCLCTRAKLVGAVMVMQSIFTLAKIQVQTFIVSSILGGGITPSNCVTVKCITS